jgi:hypothetical protein
MSFLRVAVDGQCVASIATDGREVVTAQVFGMRVDDEYATLSVSGGVYSGDGASDHRIWVDHVPLSAGQVVEVALLEHHTAVGEGRSIEELYPARETVAPSTPADNAELFADLRPYPKCVTNSPFGSPPAREQLACSPLHRMSTVSASAYCGTTYIPDAPSYLCTPTPLIASRVASLVAIMFANVCQLAGLFG